MAIGSWHVLTRFGRQRVSGHVYHPRHGALKSMVIGTVLGECENLDAVLIEVEPETPLLRHDKAVLFQVPRPTELAPPLPTVVGRLEHVSKLGPSGGHSTGRVSGFDFETMAVSEYESPTARRMRLGPTILVCGDGDKKFARKGDSGSPVFRSEKGEIYGMVSAGTKTASGHHDTLIVDINLILDKFGVRVSLR